MKPFRVLVTGASGLLGCRLVEKLLMAENVQVRAMAHRPGRSSRLARLSVDTVWCDITSAEQVCDAVKGCDVVVHCAYGAAGYSADNRKTTVEGTRILAEAAVKFGVHRFVHISSIAVYSYSPSPGITEDSPFQRPSDDYCRDKVDAEKAVWNCKNKSGLPLVVLRMGNIYGPFSSPWTVRPLNHIRERKVSLVDGGTHNSNMVFIDNAVEAILRAIKVDNAVGQAFFITDNPITWHNFYGEYAKWLAVQDVRSISSADLKPLLYPSPINRVRSLFEDLGSHIMLPTARYAAFRTATSPHLGRLASAIWGTVPQEMRLRFLGDPYGNSIPPPIQLAQSDAPGLPPLGLLEVYAGRGAFSIEKAKRILEYGPDIDTGRALSITHSWASWARIV